MTESAYDTQSQEEKDYLQQCFRDRKPYFGPLFAATQGVVIRHAYLSRMLRDFINEHGDRGPLRVLEIGSWAGGSAVTLAMILKGHAPPGGKLLCVDLWGKWEPVPPEAEYVYHAMAEAANSGVIFPLFTHNIATSGVSDTVIVARGNSLEVLPLLRDEAFDFIFVDGSHFYSIAKEDLISAKRLLRVGGIMTGDDLEMPLSMVDQETAYRFREHDYIVDPKTQRHFHPGVTLAVGEIFGEVSEREGLWAVRKTDPEGWQSCDIPDIGADPPIPMHLR